MRRTPGFCTFTLIRILVLACCTSVIACPVRASGAESAPSPDRLNFFDFVTHVPDTYANAFHVATRKDERSTWAWALGITVPLLVYDQDIYLETTKIGRRWGLSNEDNLKPYGKINDQFALMWGPSDVSSALYFLGDGWVHIGGAVFMMGYGYFGAHTRAFNTSLEMLNGFLCSTIFEQALKRAFGREDPNVQSYPGGAWRPFPSWTDYDKEKTRHDAFPSGHVMTTTVTFTVLRGNYPEYESWLLPTQIVFTSALMFGMTNNGVHWAGDYPIGIALGYFFGRAALQMSKPQADSKKESWMSPSLMPSFDRISGDPIANLSWTF